MRRAFFGKAVGSVDKCDLPPGEEGKSWRGCSGTLANCRVQGAQAPIARGTGNRWPVGRLLVIGATLPAAPPRLLILGDLLHAPIGLTPPLIDDVAGRFDALRHSRQLGTLLIRGNHDSKVDRVIAPWGLRDLGHEWTQDHAGTVIRFVHEPEAADDRAAANPQAAAVGAPAAPRSNPSAQSQPHREEAAPAPLTFAGHIHPAVRLRAAPGQGNSESLKLPCFLIRRSPPTCIPPAFTNFASGASITPNQSDQIYILIEDKVIKI
jgi:metallophosphoesterase superfamily enzyme